MAVQPPQFLSVEIPSAETSLSDRWTKVTSYDVRITAIGRREVWAVFRRYSKFYDLRLQLQKRFPNQTFPPIPPKRLLGKEDPQFIAQRRNELGEFLNALLREPVEISLSEELCLFLEVPEPLRLCLLEAAAAVGDPTRLPYLQPFEGGRSLAATGTRGPGGVSLNAALSQLGGPSGQSPQQDSSRVTLLLVHLQDLPNNKVALLRTFEGWVLKAKPQLTEADVQLLYLGFELQGGLLEEVGAFDHSEVSAIAALSLLNRLLSHEYGVEAPLFRRVLRRLDPSVLARMSLSRHILRDRGQSNRLDAFQVLESMELPQDKLMAALMQDDFALREFRRWQESQQSWLSLRTLHQPSLTSRRRTNGNIEPSGLLPRRALSTREYRRIADSAFTSVQMCLSTFTVPDGGSSSSTSLPAGFAPRQDNAAVGGSVNSVIAASNATRDSGEDTVSLDQGVMLSSGAAVAAGAAPGVAGDTAVVHTNSGGDAGGGAGNVPAHGRVGWHHIPCPEPLWESRYSLRVAYQQVTSELEPDASYILRGSLRLPFSALLVASLLADHSAFIREAMKAIEPQLTRRVANRLKGLSEGQLISQLQGTSTVEPFQLGFAYEACSEVVECSLAAPSSPHTALRLWLLKSVRILPARPGMGDAASPSRRQRWDSGSSSSLSAEGSCSSAAIAAPEPGPEAPEPARWEDPNSQETRRLRARGGEVPAPAAEPGLGAEDSPPSYLMICTAVPPVEAREASGQQEAKGDLAASIASRDLQSFRASALSGSILASSRAASAASGVAGGGLRPASAGARPSPVPELPLGEGPGFHGSSSGSAVTSPKTRNATSRLVHLKPSGVLVRPAAATSGEEAACEVNLCAILGKDNVRLLSGDLLGERLLFWQTLENLLFALEQLCPLLPQSFKPPLLAHQERCLQAGAASGDELMGTPPSSPISGASSNCEQLFKKTGQEELEVQLVEVSSSTGEGGQTVVFD